MKEKEKRARKQVSRSWQKRARMAHKNFFIQLQIRPSLPKYKVPDIYWQDPPHRNVVGHYRLMDVDPPPPPAIS